MSMIDVLSTYRIPFSGTLDNASGNHDLVAIRNVNQVSCLLEVLEVNVAMVSETTLTANEHIGLFLAQLFDDTTPSAIAAGTGGADITTSVEHGFPLEMIDAQRYNALGNLFTVRSCDTGVAAGTATTIREKWGDGWNVQIPFSKVWLPGDRPTFTMNSDSNGSAGNIDTLVLRTDGAPSADIDVRGYMVVRYARFGWD